MHITSAVITGTLALGQQKPLLAKRCHAISDIPVFEIILV